MTRSFVYSHPDDSLRNCAKIMINKRVGSLILKEKDELKGIITQKDILWALIKKNKDLDNIKAKDISTKKIITINPSASLEKAFEKMKKNNFKWLPVVSKKKVVGMLTIKDLLVTKPDFHTEFERTDISEEEDKVKRIEKIRTTNETVGICGECGSYDELRKLEGRDLCGFCQDADN